jgi:hypothetical protein
MLTVSGDLTIQKGQEKIEFKTSSPDLLVLSFSSWSVFGDALSIPKSRGISPFSLRKKLKFVSHPVEIFVSDKKVLELQKGEIKEFSFSSIIKLIRYTFFH